MPLRRAYLTVVTIFEVSTAVIVRIAVLWHAGPSSLVDRFQRFRGSCGHHLQSRVALTVVCPTVAYINLYCPVFLISEEAVRHVDTPLIESVSAGVTVSRIKRKGLGRNIVGQTRLRPPASYSGCSTNTLLFSRPSTFASRASDQTLQHTKAVQHSLR
jgi:hypothetical protein